MAIEHVALDVETYDAIMDTLRKLYSATVPDTRRDLCNRMHALLNKAVNIREEDVSWK